MAHATTPHPSTEAIREAVDFALKNGRVIAWDQSTAGRDNEDLTIKLVVRFVKD